MNHINTAALVTILRTALFLAASAMASEGLAFPVAPATLSYAASITSPTPPSQTVTFSKKSLVPRLWTASGDAAWIAISPPSGTISREQDQIVVQVNATGMAAGTYSGTVRIAITDKNDRTQVTPVPVTLSRHGAALPQPEVCDCHPKHSAQSDEPEFFRRGRWTGTASQTPYAVEPDWRHIDLDADRNGRMARPQYHERHHDHRDR